MLFSEPKIPQSCWSASPKTFAACFSALQRAENSSILDESVQCQDRTTPVSVLFSEPKIPQCRRRYAVGDVNSGFSALQRAENSSIVNSGVGFTLNVEFQCSSASRKFLNLNQSQSIRKPWDVSVLFSEPKIPQSFQLSACRPRRSVSVLFSEPKIPQCAPARSSLHLGQRFSALQRAENSSMSRRARAGRARSEFQCSSASRKFLNLGCWHQQ